MANSSTNGQPTVSIPTSERSSPGRTASATFGLFQFEAAQQIDAPTQITVGAQAVGGAIGILISIHNVVAALTVVGLIGEEGRVIRLELMPLAYYGVATGIPTVLLAYVFVPGAS